VYATPEGPQGVQGIIENYVFFNMIRGCDKQLSNPGKNGFLRFLNPLRELVSVVLEQRSVIEGVPREAGGIAGHSSAHKRDPRSVDGSSKGAVSGMRPNGGPSGNNTLGENPGTSGKSRSLHRRKEKLWKGAKGAGTPFHLN
jgi:hypothetical protein